MSVCLQAHLVHLELHEHRVVPAWCSSLLPPHVGYSVCGLVHLSPERGTATTPSLLPDDIIDADKVDLN